MEKGKKSISVAASSTYADKLARRASRLDLERDKGKGEASDNDMDFETKMQGDNSLIRSRSRKGSSRDRHVSTVSPSLRAKRASPIPQYQHPTEEYTNPFTGLPVVQERGFEPGPSSRPGPPVQESSRKAASGPENLQHRTKAPATFTGTALTTMNSEPQPRASEQKTHQLFSRQPNMQSSSGTTTNSALTADEAFARSLQQEEFRDLQRERDMFLTHALANGTADDGDVELAHFMSRETEDLMASTGTTAGGLQVSEGPFQADSTQWDMETQQMQMDLLYALELEHALRAEDSAYNASLSEAMRLQAEFDAELDRDKQNHEAWEEWKKSNIVECIVCGDEHHTEELLRPCEHGYCEGCLQEGFKNAMASKTPLKCCKKALSVDDCSGLDATFVTKYKDFMLEFSTPNPMYCSNASCSKFLPPHAIVGEIGTCGSCGTQTCRHCKKLLHPGVFCEEDQETKAVKELAMQKGWKSCPGCNHLIEREFGCLYMTCSRCQTAFCYRCAKKWNECASTCPDAISATHPKF